MYSPKISSQFIPSLYRIAKVKRIPMTKLVNRIILDFLAQSDSQVLEQQYQTKGEQSVH